MPHIHPAVHRRRPSCRLPRRLLAGWAIGSWTAVLTLTLAAPALPQQPDPRRGLPPQRSVRPATAIQPEEGTPRMAPRRLGELEMVPADGPTNGPSDDGLMPLAALPLVVRPSAGELPDDYAAGRFGREGVIYDDYGASRRWLGTGLYWEASAFRHYPLYFEDITAERYGHHHGCAQPLVSAAHFFGTVPLLPYKMVAHCPHECVYTLGHYRPGVCVPPHCNCCPLRLDAAAAEAGVIAGLILVIP